MKRSGPLRAIFDPPIQYGSPGITAQVGEPPAPNPSVTINQAASQTDPTGSSSILFTVVFSEAVSGFATGDVTLSGTAGATTATVSGSGPTYDVTVTGMTTSPGTVIATIAAGVATSVASGKPNLASTSTDNTVTYAVYCDNFDTVDGLTGWVNGPWSTTAVTEASSGGGGVAQSGTSGAEQDAYLNTDLGSVNHWAEIDVVQDTTGCNFGLLVRCNASTNTNYMARYDKNTSQWQIYRRVAGSFTQLANTGTGPPSAGTYRIRLTVQTVGGNVDLKLYQVSGGVPTLKLSTTDSSGSKITAGNFAGIRPAGSSGNVAIGDNFCAGPI